MFKIAENRQNLQEIISHYVFDLFSKPCSLEIYCEIDKKPKPSEAQNSDFFDDFSAITSKTFAEFLRNILAELNRKLSKVIFWPS